MNSWTKLNSNVFNFDVILTDNIDCNCGHGLNEYFKCHYNSKL